jgi:RNA polymerase sigma factor (sigma-70 family)
MMEPALNSRTFAQLLDCLDADRKRAGEKYEDLRRTLIRFFSWRGAPFPEEHADETFNRLARKLGDGIEINNIGAYAYEVARLVCLEALKAQAGKRAPLDAIKHQAAPANFAEEAAEREMRLACLDDCLAALPTEGRQLIVAYYRDESRDRIDRRRALAEQLGLQREALANRAQRVRDKLEHCVTRCLRKKLAI